MIALASIARVAVYARVSTTRQAEADLSVPDQLRTAEAWCAARGWMVTDTFVEPGASGMDEDRPVFQRMIEAATGPGRPYDVILVHSLSRFFRDAMYAEMYVRRLRRVGVSVLSITQEFGSDTTGDVVRKILSVFDEYQSRENAKHTHRAMVENARQGFWNGSIAPFGYCVVAAGQKGARTKKVLAIDECEAAMVRRIFALYLGESGLPQGIKAIAKTLNAEGARFRGKRFATSNVHRVLTEEAYAGTHWFNKRDSRTRERRPRSAWVPMPTPGIIPPGTFARAAALLAERNRKRTPPRVVNGPSLLTGIARCEACGAGLTLRTGKSGPHRAPRDVGVDGPAALDAKVGLSHNQPRSRPMELKRIAMDTSKHAFTLHGVDAEDRVVLPGTHRASAMGSRGGSCGGRRWRRSSPRSRRPRWCCRAPSARARWGPEACGASHHWGRLLQGGHRVRLIPAQYVKPFVKRGKSDRIDGATPRSKLRGDPGEAIAEAAERPEPKATPGWRYIGSCRCARRSSRWGIPRSLLRGDPRRRCCSRCARSGSRQRTQVANAPRSSAGPAPGGRASAPARRAGPGGRAAPGLWAAWTGCARPRCPQAHQRLQDDRSLSCWASSFRSLLGQMGVQGNGVQLIALFSQNRPCW
jgi:DNA invertase Pin-like site-specific DNA recombinase